MAKLITQLGEEDEAPRSLMRRLRELERGEERLVGLVEASPAPKVVRLPTNYGAVYRRAIDDLSGHLSSSDAARTRKSVRQIITKLVSDPGTRVVVTCVP